MANTVNDVMNVIASPDYGIKNIAGTNQEILAILSGTHNSKNSIYSRGKKIESHMQNKETEPLLCISFLNPSSSHCSEVHSVVFNFLQPLGLQPARFLCPWNSPRKTLE